ncbi:hypothetical protein [Streptomyces cavernae]|uniref:hypothetical protein n=1 Tax=Streptomyces cavernae TaxID=2259034 RepID=UPI000FEB74D1|nr:hypothetical protein [Streptomyces cavernae]
MDSKEPVCPICGQPVAKVLRRHKTLGVFVPVWRPGPCRNPRCEAYEEQAEHTPAPSSARVTEPGPRGRTEPAPPGKAEPSSPGNSAPASDKPG